MICHSGPHESNRRASHSTGEDRGRNGLHASGPAAGLENLIRIALMGRDLPGDRSAISSITFFTRAVMVKPRVNEGCSLIQDGSMGALPDYSETSWIPMDFVTSRRLLG